MCEDIHSGYFAGSFMGRKFKSTPSAKEFERSLEYLLDDLSTSSGCDQASQRTPSICSGSINSLDTVVVRDVGTPDSAVSSVRDGFMIDITVTENSQKKKRPRSDIYDFIQGTGIRNKSSDQYMLKTKSLCDVSHTNSMKDSAEAKQYEMEFESMLDELHSTIEDLDTFSRENIGVSLESLDSVSSMSKSGRVSPISLTSESSSYSYSAGELKISESALSTDSNSFSSISDRNRVHSSKLHISDSIDSSVVSFNGFSTVSTGACNSEGKQALTSSVSDVSSTFSVNEKDSSHFSKPAVEKQQSHIVTKQENEYSADMFCGKTKTHADTGSLLKDKFKFLPDISTDCKRGVDVGFGKSDVNSKIDLHLQKDIIPSENVRCKEESSVDNKKPLPGEKVSLNDTKCQNPFDHKTHPPTVATIDLQKYTIKSHHINQVSNFVTGSNSPPPQQSSDQDPGGSIMSSATDLSGMASEIGYIADMDESVFNETPDYNAPWLDAAINENMESEMGDCFVHKGFRPLNFIGVESKYMISPIKGNELRIPTPVKLRKETGTQTCDEPNIISEKDYQSLNSKDNEDKQASFDAVCTSTQTDSSLQCSCGGRRDPLYSHLETEKKEFYKIQSQEAGKRNSNIPYCSSVEISPLLNGSQSSKYMYYHCLARANSLDTGLSSENKNQALVSKKDVKSSFYLTESDRVKLQLTDKRSAIERNRLQETIKSQNLEGNKNEQCHLTPGHISITSSKQPEILVTLHNLPDHKHHDEPFVAKNVFQQEKCEENATERFLSPEYCSYRSCRSIKCESVPNISYSQCGEQSHKQKQVQGTPKHQDTMRRYASVLIISNINKHLQLQSQENGKAIKRSSYERDVTFSHHQHQQQRQSKTARQENDTSHQGSATAVSSKNQTLGNNHRKMMSYTF